MKKVAASHDDIYEEACTRIDEVVADVLEQLDEVADDADYQREWVIERFRDRFNSKVRKILHG